MTEIRHSAISTSHIRRWTVYGVLQRDSLALATVNVLKEEGKIDDVKK